MTDNTDRPSPSFRKPPLRRRVLMVSAAALIGAGVLAGAWPGSPPFSQALVASAKATERWRHPEGFADIVAAVTPAVISVRVKVEKPVAHLGDDDAAAPYDGSPFEHFFRRFGQPDGQPDRQVVTGQGSGFFISADGYAVTNNHVVDGAKTVEIATSEGKSYRAAVVGVDPQTDLALIKVDGDGDFPHVTFADAPPRVGDWVLAVGNPFGLSKTVTAGIVSAHGRDIGAGPYDDFIQIDAPINKGNSGGPTFDVDGKVVGVNTAIYSPSGGSIGIGFAIPADTVKTVVAQLKQNGSVVRGWLGVQIQKVTPDIADSLGLAEAEGALVAAQQPGSPAAKAGVQAGDVILSVDGAPVRDAHELARTISGKRPGSSVDVTLLRRGERKTLSVTLARLPAAAEERADAGRDASPTDGARLGLSLAPASSVGGAGEDGVVVTGVDPAGLAAERGVQTGDVILDVGGKSVATPADVRAALREAQGKGKRTVLFRLQSAGGNKFVALPTGKGHSGG